MSLIDSNTLKAFVSERSWLTAESPAGLSEAIAQVDNIIYQYTNIAVPSNPTDANPTLRNIACALTIWFTTGQQSKIEEQELKRRQDMYINAMKVLESIKNGDLILMDASGIVITGRAEMQSMFESTQRLTEQL